MLVTSNYVTAFKGQYLLMHLFIYGFLLFLPLHSYSSSVDSMIHSYSRQSSEHEEVCTPQSTHKLNTFTPKIMQLQCLMIQFFVLHTQEFTFVGPY